MGSSKPQQALITKIILLRPLLGGLHQALEITDHEIDLETFKRLFLVDHDKGAVRMTNHSQLPSVHATAAAICAGLVVNTTFLEENARKWSMTAYFYKQGISHLVKVVCTHMYVMPFVLPKVPKLHWNTD